MQQIDIIEVLVMQCILVDRPILGLERILTGITCKCCWEFLAATRKICDKEVFLKKVFSISNFSLLSVRISKFDSNIYRNVFNVMQYYI